VIRVDLEKISHFRSMTRVFFRVQRRKSELVRLIATGLEHQGKLYTRNRDIVKRFARLRRSHSRDQDAAKKRLKAFAVRMRIDDPEMVRTIDDYFAPRFSFPPPVSREGGRHTLNFYAEQNSDFRTASRRSLSISR